jgi:hypothetical protein
MNERIRELAEQARAWAETAYKQQNDQFTSHWDTPIGYTPSQFFEQKFAELIVLECNHIIAKQAWESRTAGANGDWAEYNALSRVAGQIKQHFGVEE